jgi:purine catabolism regulator
VFLSAHGGHRASAARLGIHRQTLVSRIRRVEDLTGLSMDRADDRAAAWLALRASGF